MPTPSPGAIFYVQSVNPGVDANRITVILTFTYGPGGASAELFSYDFNRYVITLNMGFNDVSGTNVDWATAASAVNVVAGNVVQAAGAADDTSVLAGGLGGLTGGFAGGYFSQYYSPSVGPPPPVVIRKKLPQFIRGRL
jgi:hypothetical protein